MTAEDGSRPEPEFDGRRREIREALEALRALDPARRRDALRQLCGSDADLLARVDALLDRAGGDGPLDPTSEVPTEAIDEVSEPPPLGPGARVGPYTILTRLGRGGMGTVYLALPDGDAAPPVALKQLHPVGTSPAMLRRFHAEREILAGLAHPDIVRLLDGGTTEAGAPYLVMEYVDGLTLDRYADAAGRDVQLCAGLVHQVARAMAYAHDQGIVHRDLKPANVLVTREGRAKVTDFGLARPIVRGEQTTLTGPGAILGTPSYAAPEQLGEGEGRNLPAVDCYSLGAILYRLLAGVPPFRGETPLETCMQVLNSRPAPLRRLRHEVPRDLETIVLKAMAREPAERFATAGAMAEQLRRFLAGERLTVARPSSRSRLGRWAAQHRRGLAAWAATVALLLAALVGVLIVDNARIHRAYEAERLHRARAQAILQTVRSLFQKTTLATEDLTEAIPLGSDRAHAYLSQMQQFYEQVLRQVPEFREDPEVLYRAALANYHLARSFESRDLRGNLPEMLRWLGRSVELLEPLARDHPENVWYRYNLFRGLARRAVFNPDRARGEADSREALRVIADLAADFPDDPAWRDAVAAQHYNLAVVLMNRGQLDESDCQGREALEVASRLVERYPDEPRYLANVYRAQAHLADLAVHRGDLAAAEAALRRALEANAGLRAGGPDPLYYPFERAVTLRALARVWIRQGRYPEAEAALTEALEIGRRYAGDAPENDTYGLFPLEVRTDLGHVHHRAGRHAEAEGLFRAVIDDLEARVAAGTATERARLMLEDLRRNCPVVTLRTPAPDAGLRAAEGQAGTAP